MNKQGLRLAVAAKTHLPEDIVGFILDGFFEVMQETLQKGDDLTIKDVGTFDVGVRKARKVRNPHTGEVIDVPEIRLARFRAGKEFKERLNKK